MRRFEASPRRATPKGHKTFIHCTAPPSPGPTYRTPAPAFMAHGHTRNITPVQTPGLQRVGEPQELTRTLDARSRSHLTVTSATLDTPALVWPIGRYRAPNPSETKEKHRWSIAWGSGRSARRSRLQKRHVGPVCSSARSHERREKRSCTRQGHLSDERDNNMRVAIPKEITHHPVSLAHRSLPAVTGSAKHPDGRVTYPRS